LVERPPNDVFFTAGFPLHFDKNFRRKETYATVVE
jgi:hypothetical protein